MKKRIIYIAVLPLLFGGLLFGQTTGSAPKVESLLLTVEGQVQVMPVGGTAWAVGQTNQPLHIGDRLRTGARSRATVRLSDLTVLRVNELTTLQIRPPQNPGKQSLLDVNSGSAYFMGREKAAEQEFRTPLTSGAIRGTEFNIAVADDGRTVVTLMDGLVTLSNSLGQVDMASGEQGIVDPGKAPVKTAMIEAVNIIQWSLYYPGVLDADELELTADERRELADSLSAYASGDLLQAVALYPTNRTPTSDADRVYRAATLLSVGQVEQAQSLLAGFVTYNQPPSRSVRLAISLNEMIAAVKNQPGPRATNATLATELLAESYYFQSHGKLAEALKAARASVAQAPNFGFGWARVAELELGFGHQFEALAALETSLRLSPRNAQSLAVKGFVLSAQNRITAAQTAFDEAIALDGALGNAWLGRGLCRIYRGDSREGLHDLQVAAVLEPQRSVLRGYVAKAYSEAGDDIRARKELSLARRLDPNDPTSWLYSALINQQDNQINDAVRDLEKSEQLNNNRRIFRSRLLLDEDQAVRSANLANIYQDAGMFDWSVREASRAVDLDYGNYSAHQFLAASYDALRDPKEINLRYETPWFSELLLSELLSPVSAGNLSEYSSQRQYPVLFEGNHFGASSDTQYSSHGDWLERASQYGNYDDVAYAIDAEYRKERGERINDQLEQFTLSIKGKDQLTPQDSIFIKGDYFKDSFGDNSQIYNQYGINYFKNGSSTGVPPTGPDLTLNGTEKERPNVFVGYHHEWEPGVHTLFLGGRLNDVLHLNDPYHIIPLVSPTSISVPGPPFYAADLYALDFKRYFDAYTAEVEQIWQSDRQTLVAGARYQYGWNTTGSTASDQYNGGQPTFTEDYYTHLERYGVYAYETVKILDQIQITGGVSYDHVHYPRDIDTSPITNDEADTDQVSPKAGIIWSPFDATHFRAAYTRSLGGVFDDTSVRLEPVEVAGFTQAFRSIAPESVIGQVPGTRFTTYGIGLDQQFKNNTYLSIDAEMLESDADRTIGAQFDNDPNLPTAFNTRQTLHYREKTLSLSLNQLLGRDWSLGGKYELSYAELHGAYEDISGASYNQRATFQQLNLFINYYNPCGFFSQGQALWTAQNSQGYSPGLDSASFWQLNAYAGYRFLHRHAEGKVGVLNITDRNYLLNPLNLYYDLPRDRTFVAEFKFYF